MSTRQDTLEDRLTTMEDKLVALQEQLDLLPDLIATRIQSQVSNSSLPLKPFRQFWDKVDFFSAREDRTKAELPAPGISGGSPAGP